MHDSQGDDGGQQEGRAHRGVDEELDRRVHPARPSPNPDDEIHGHQDHLEEHEEQQQVESQK